MLTPWVGWDPGPWGDPAGGARFARARADGRALRARTGGRALRTHTAPSAPPGPRGQGAVGIIPRLFRMEVLSSGVNRRPAGRGLKALPNDWRFLNGNELRKPSVTPRAKNLESTYKRWDWNLSFGTSGRPWTRNDPKSYRTLPFGAFGHIWAALKPKRFQCHQNFTFGASGQRLARN